MPHALIVDDDTNTREALAEIIRAEGFTHAIAGNIQEAQGQIAAHSPDIVLIDLVLPDGDGMDLFKEYETHANMQIVLITGHASVETAVVPACGEAACVSWCGVEGGIGSGMMERRKKGACGMHAVRP
jgi:DNA-binding NtrC family response regulator